MTAPDRVAELRAAQAEVDAETLAEAATFPTYEVPAIAAERFPGFDPADPSTWPEPDKCTEGRPWGHEAYGYSTGAAIEQRWANYLRGFSRPCRNRWKDAETHLCGTHVKVWNDRVESSRRRAAARERELRHLDLAKRLAAHGIVADGVGSGVLLRADAVEQLLDRLALLAGAIPRSLHSPTPDTYTE